MSPSATDADRLKRYRDMAVDKGIKIEDYSTSGL